MRRNILKLLVLAPFALLFTSCEKKISHEHNDFLWVKLDEIILEDYFCS